jgi:hypothetical protein
MGGTAPTERDWLLVEYAGAWGRQAVAESRLPETVRRFLGGLSGPRVQLIRRYGGASGPGIRLFRARLGEDPAVYSCQLDEVLELPEMDLAWESARSSAARWVAHREPVFLVCTNGGRDRCCAELGRPIAARLAERWPAETWETTHLGGHRFAGTLLALPSAITLGRLDPDAAVSACADILAGRYPYSVSRGRAGFPAAAQVAELHLRRLSGLEHAELDLLGIDGEEIRFRTVDGIRTVRVRSEPGISRRQSCADGAAKSVAAFRVV